MLPHRLKAARLKAGLSQERLGILAGIDEATASACMNQYERGIHTSDFELASQLASVLHVPACYFYTLEDDLAETILGYSDSQENQPYKGFVESIECLLC